jgi:hypothetical protein
MAAGGHLFLQKLVILVDVRLATLTIRQQKLKIMVIGRSLSSFKFLKLTAYGQNILGSVN